MKRPNKTRKDRQLKFEAVYGGKLAKSTKPAVNATKNSRSK
jgi:hypothetical protein